MIWIMVDKHDEVVLGIGHSMREDEVDYDVLWLIDMMRSF